VRGEALSAAEAAAALKACGACDPGQAAEAAARLAGGRGEGGLPVKHLLALVDLARLRLGRAEGTMSAEDLVETAAQLAL